MPGRQTGCSARRLCAVARSPWGRAGREPIGRTSSEAVRRESTQYPERDGEASGNHARAREVDPKKVRWEPGRYQSRKERGIQKVLPTEHHHRDPKITRPSRIRFLLEVSVGAEPELSRGSSAARTNAAPPARKARRRGCDRHRRGRPPEVLKVKKRTQNKETADHESREARLLIDRQADSRCEKHRANQVRPDRSHRRPRRNRRQAAHIFPILDVLDSEDSQSNREKDAP